MIDQHSNRFLSLRFEESFKHPSDEGHISNRTNNLFRMLADLGAKLCRLRK